MNGFNAEASTGKRRLEKGAKLKGIWYLDERAFRGASAGGGAENIMGSATEEENPEALNE